VHNQVPMMLNVHPTTGTVTSTKEYA
jgi:hypothetical protein